MQRNGIPYELEMPRPGVAATVLEELPRYIGAVNLEPLVVGYQRLVSGQAEVMQQDRQEDHVPVELETLEFLVP